MKLADHKKKIGAGAAGTAAVLTLLFMQAFGSTMLVEGGYANHQDDLGGSTMYGITEAVARADGYRGAMRDLPQERAQRIAKEKYWDTLRLDDVGAKAPDLAKLLFDVGFNTGVSRSGRWFQECLNVLNNKGRHYGDIAADGKVGRWTIFAFHSLMDRRGARGEDALETCVRGQLVYHYIYISQRREANESFTFGWMLRATE